MAKYSFNDMGGIEIDFNGIKPSCEIRNKMKAVKYHWNPNKMIWWAYKNDDTVAVAKEICVYSAPIALDSPSVKTAGAAVIPDKCHQATNKIYRTASGRVISFYGVNAGNAIYSIDENERLTLNEFFEIMLKSWVKESAYPSTQKDPQFNLSNDPTYGQCAVTAMLVNKFFGGEIRKIRVSGGGTHYFNVINGQVFDLTRDQFDLYNIPVDYSTGINVPLQYCGKNANTRDRYNILKKNVIKTMI